MRLSFVPAASVALCMAGCFNTPIVTGLRGDGATHHGRQWFTVGGLLPLSNPARECAGSGLAYAESKLDVFDVLLQLGVGFVGSLVGSALCPLPENQGELTRDEAITFGACVAGSSTLAVFLIAARSVRYECAATASMPATTPP